MADGDTVTVRLAVAADYPAVIEIGKGIYSGFDYMPELFSWMLHSSDHFPFVATIGGQVVGFNNYRIVDDGKTALTMASRVTNGYKGRGINEKMKDKIDVIMRKKFPTLSSRVWTSWGSDAQDRYFAKNPGKFQQLFQWKIYLLLAKPPTRSSGDYCYETGSDVHILPVLPLREATDLLPGMKALLSQHATHIVYPEFCPWCVLELTDASLRHVVKTCDVIASFGAQIDDKRHLASVTFFNTMKVEQSEEGLDVCCTAMHYGSSSAHLSDHLATILRKMSKIIPKNTASTGIFLHVSNDACHDVLQRKLSEKYEISSGRNDGLLTCTSF